MIDSILDFEPAPSVQDKFQSSDHVKLVNLRQAQRALNLIKESKDNASEYARLWKQSGLAEVTDRLSAVSREGTHGMPFAIEDLLEEVVVSTDANVTRRRAEIEGKVAARTDEQLMDSLGRAVDLWATASHAELRDGPQSAIEGRGWAKLHWWKLFWRVDDVGMILAQVVERAWLVGASETLTWIEGRYAQARLDVSKHTQSAGPYRVANYQQNQIEVSRKSLLSDSLPSLEALAQRQVVQAVSLTTTSSAFAALVYFTWPVVTAWQAGAFAALGLVWSLRRLQNNWETAKDAWLESIQEAGRRTLRNIEDTLKVQLQRGPAPSADHALILEELSMAQSAVEEARTSLEQIRSNDPRVQG